MYIIAFDFGTKNTGVAIGQYVTCTAKPLISLKMKNGIPDWQLVSKIIHEWQPSLGIVGLPLNTNGEEQSLTKKARKFAELLRKKLLITIIMHDERLTTIEARSNIFNQSGYRKLQKKIIDSVAAVIILESWLEHNPITNKINLK